MPPAMMATHTGKMIQASETNPVRLSRKSENPALLNAEIEWNTPYQTAFPQLSSYPSRNRRVSATAMTVSKTSTVTATRRTTSRTSPMFSGVGLGLGDQ